MNSSHLLMLVRTVAIVVCFVILETLDVSHPGPPHDLAAWVPYEAVGCDPCCIMRETRLPRHVDCCVKNRQVYGQFVPLPQAIKNLGITGKLMVVGGFSIVVLARLSQLCGLFDRMY